MACMAATSPTCSIYQLECFLLRIDAGDNMVVEYDIIILV